MTYPITEEMRVRLDNNFSYHAPFGNQAGRYSAIRGYALNFAEFIVTRCPPSRELSRALSALDDVVFNANSAIARNETTEV